MADLPPPYRTSDQAAFIYFDAAPTYGTLNGAVQIELVSRVMRPIGPGPTDIAVEFLITDHIRCSPAAAISLRDALNRALELLQQPQAAPATEANKLN
jgi:hypothetical protein